MLVKILSIILRFIILLFILSLEHTVGLPWLFIFLALLWMKTTEGKLVFLLIFLFSFFTGVIYSLPFILSFFIFFVLYFLATQKEFWERRQVSKTLFISLIVNLLLSFFIPNFIWVGWTFAQLFLFLFLINIGVYFLRRKGKISLKI